MAEILQRGTDGPTIQEQNAIRAIAKPFYGYTDEGLRTFASDFIRKAQLGNHLLPTFEKGAFLALKPTRFLDDNNGLNLTDDEMTALKYENEHKWNISRTLLSLITVCSLSAAIQGTNETVVNGAQVFYGPDFGINGHGIVSKSRLGILNAAPYLSCALLGCWLTEPMNKRFGRRGTIFIACVISSASCLWQAFTFSWQQMFAARLLLGLGIGPKSATVPIYAAESSPPSIRGALTMMWQTFVALGIAVGFILSVGFFRIESSKIKGLNWRLMMASPMVLPLIVCALVFFCPESPRWLIDRERFQEAFEGLESLRGTKIQAARDLLHIYASLRAEKQIRREKGGFQRRKELFTVPRNWRALRASTIVMALQQLGGVNVIVYYSSQILVDNGFKQRTALLASMGFGIINFVFALPAVWTIDTFGRRNLLLVTFPLMAIFMLFTGFSFCAPEGKTRVALVCIGIYLFGAAYSPGEGPVPFVYSAECYPLYLRDIGMSWSTSVTWFLNFGVAMTLPLLSSGFKPQGTFAFYAAWNAIGFFLIFFFVPETKGKTLEGLDKVFRRSTTRTSIRSIGDILQGQKRRKRESQDYAITTPSPKF